MEKKRKIKAPYGREYIVLNETSEYKLLEDTADDRKKYLVTMYLDPALNPKWKNHEWHGSGKRTDDSEEALEWHTASIRHFKREKEQFK